MDLNRMKSKMIKFPSLPFFLYALGFSIAELKGMWTVQFFVKNHSSFPESKVELKQERKKNELTALSKNSSTYLHCMNNGSWCQGNLHIILTTGELSGYAY
jgi:hypothetical protein